MMLFMRSQTKYCIFLFVNRWTSSVGDRSQSWQELRQICKCTSPTWLTLYSVPPSLDTFSLPIPVSSLFVPWNDVTFTKALRVAQWWLTHAILNGIFTKSHGVNMGCHTVFVSQTCTKTHTHGLQNGRVNTHKYTHTTALSSLQQSVLVWWFGPAKTGLHPCFYLLLFMRAVTRK